MEDSYELYEWIDKHKTLHLTINDVNKLSVGDKLDVVLFDRNVEEYGIWDKLKRETPYDPQDFFKWNRAILVYKGGENRSWDIHFSFGETHEHPAHINVEHLPTNWHWTALEKDGYVHITNNILNTGETLVDYPDHHPIHLQWEDFSGDTTVGWRGPIMLWKDLRDKPKVYCRRLIE